MTQDLINKYVYDQEGRLCAVQNILAGTATQYVYDAEGTRVAKGTLNTWPASGSPCAAPTTANTFSASSVWLKSAIGGEDTQIQWSPNVASGVSPVFNNNVYVGGSLLATYSFSQNANNVSQLNLSFAFNDWLGGKRLQINSAGQAVNTWASDPFGNYLTPGAGGSSDATDHHYTGKERDAESGNDYFGARYYASSMGRFMSPDPSGLEYADPTNPQSLNLYSYVLNNPLHNIDPTGLYCDYSDHSDPSSGFDSSQFDYNSNSGECSTNGGQWVDDAYTHNGADDANRPQEAVSSLTTAPNTPWTYDDFQTMYQAWDQGLLPQQLNYGPWSWETIDMSHNFAVNRARAAYIKAGCPASGTPANSMAAGHYESYADSAGNIVLGQPDWLEAEVGGWSGTITTSEDNTTFTINNPMSNSSFNGMSAFGGNHASDNPNGPNGPRHTAMQTFKWTEFGLCHQ